MSEYSTGVTSRDSSSELISPPMITIASGVAQFDFALFVFASIISRSLRFFIVAALLWQFGDAARGFIERRLTLVTTLFAVGLVGGFVVLRYL